MKRAGDEEVVGEARFNAEGNQSFVLRVGSLIKLRAESPAYRVTQITGGEHPSIVMKFPDGVHYKDFPSVITVAGHGVKTIGRNPANDAVVPHSNISRKHLTLEYNAKRESFVMVAHNHNDGFISNATQIGVGVARHRDDELASQIRRVGLEEIAEVALRTGMILQILPNSDGANHIPCCEVVKARGGDRPELELAIVGDARKCPRSIRMTGVDAVKTIGRAEDGNEVVIPHPDISRDHASIRWDKADQSWVYTSDKVAPEVHMGSAFLAEMQRRADAIHPENVDAAKMEIHAIDRLVGRMEQARDGMPNVQMLMDKVQGHEIASYHDGGYDGGGRTEESQKGYQHWVQAYQMLYKDSLSAEAQQQLEQAQKAIGFIGVHRQMLREIEHRFGPHLLGDVKTFEGLVAGSKSV